MLYRGQHAHTTTCHTLVNVEGPSQRGHSRGSLILIHCSALEQYRVDIYRSNCCQTKKRSNALCRSRRFTMKMMLVQHQFEFHGKYCISHFLFQVHIVGFQSFCCSVTALYSTNEVQNTSNIFLMSISGRYFGQSTTQFSLNLNIPL